MSEDACEHCDGTGEGPFETSCPYCQGSGFPKQYAEPEEPFELNYG